MESILNVDDYGPGRYARTRVLQHAGFAVREASTGKEALRLVAEHTPPIILLDVNLPDMSGFDVCKQIKRDPRTGATTILHISATNVQTHHQVEGLDCGADSYLVEPVDPAVLIATIKAFLRARRAEDALRRSNEELERFAYRVAHDLSEPLRTMAAHTRLLERDLGPALNEHSSKSLHFVVDAASRMRMFIDGLLNYAHVGHGTFDSVDLDCEAVLGRVVLDLDALIRASGTQVTHDPLPVVPADPALEQVFLNLISNAIKYRREDVPPEIHVSVKPEGAMWEFSVRDNGLGIKTAHQANIFQTFQRLHGPEIPGSGIGLALCKKIVESHGGSIWVQSEIGQGSTFFFSLPKAVA
jgi:two-component system sensor histidine kinase/response regulator